jgi:hypothetical protein
VFRYSAGNQPYDSLGLFRQHRPNEDIASVMETARFIGRTQLTGRPRLKFLIEAQLVGTGGKDSRWFWGAIGTIAGAEDEKSP